MTPPRSSDPEHVRCKYWREEIVKMSRQEVADLTGMSVSRIADFEAGMNRATKTPIDEASMKRYRMACAAVTLGCRFDWLSCRLITELPVEIRLFK
jgi:transcriptional regulator with XRE-family HTH domain